MQPESGAGLWLVAIDGGAPRRLTTPSADAGDPRDAHAAGGECGRCYGLAWLGRGPQLLVAGDWFGESGLRVVEPDGQARRIGAEHARFPDVSLSGDIVYERARDGSGERSGRSRIEAAAMAVGAIEPVQIDLMIARR